MHGGIQVLGGLALVDPGGAVRPLGAQAGRLLAMLVIGFGGVVRVPALAEAMWELDGESDLVRLRMAVSRLRSRLASVGMPDAIHASGSAYRLVVPEDAIDAVAFRHDVELARGLSRTRPDEAKVLLEAGLGRWKGEAFGSLASEPWAIGAANGLEELRLAAEDEWAAAVLATGGAAGAVDQLAAAAERQPLRERRWVHLATALYRTGRQAEALRTIQRARVVLLEEVGVDPGPDLQRVERAILDQHESLEDVPVPVPEVDWSPRLEGRTRDIAAVEELLGANRVVSIVGLGGIGKSALARAVCARLPSRDAVIHVPLDGLAGAVEVRLAVARAAGLGAGDDPAALVAALAERFARAPVLVLDGADAGAAAVATVLDELRAVSPRIRALVTARVPIGAVDEVRYALGPLDVGSADDPGAAVDLFLARSGLNAHAIGVNGLATVVDLCRRAAGLPLAVELAASSVDLHGLAALTAGGIQVDDAVRVAVDRSLDLLPDASRELFLHLALLPDGASLELAGELAGVGAAKVRATLGPLAQLRLVDVHSGPLGLRYRSLEPVREAALGIVADDDRRATAILDALIALCERTGEVCAPMRLDAMPVLEAELGNIRHWLAHTPDPVTGLALAVTASRCFAALGHGAEAGTWLRLHGASATDADPVLRVRALLAGADAAGFGAGAVVAVETLVATRATAAEHGRWDLWLYATAYEALARGWAGDVAAALELLDGPETTERMRTDGTPWHGLMRARIHAFGRFALGELEPARAALVATADELDQIGDPVGAVSNRYMGAVISRLLGDLEGAATLLATARALAPAYAGCSTLALIEMELAVLARADRPTDAATLLSTAIDALEQVGNMRGAALARQTLGRWRLEDGDASGRDLVREAVGVLLIADRRNASVGVAVLADLVQRIDPAGAARLATAARRWAHHDPGPQPIGADIELIDQIAGRLTDAAAPADDDEGHGWVLPLLDRSS